MLRCRGLRVSLLISAILFLCHLQSSIATSSQFCESKNKLSGPVQVAPGFCPVVWASRLGSPRGLKVASNGDVLVIERSRSTITVLWDADKNGVSDTTERASLARLQGLNHGIAIDERNNWLYASTSREVYRWNYRAGTRSQLENPIKVIHGIPCCHHTTRTLLVRPDGGLLVTVGSASNLDENDLHARIHLFHLADLTSHPVGVHWSTGTVFARGLRNEVGITYDNLGRVWGVENGVDDLRRPDLGPDLVYNNPGEEVNLFIDEPEKYDRFYGYPFCWSEYLLPPSTAQGRNSQWAHPYFMNMRPEGHDSWCKNPDNVIKPVFSLPPHSAPLDIMFYYGTTFPNDYVGDAFVALHGSWNRIDPIGYAVVRLHFKDGMPVNYTTFLANGQRKRDVNDEVMQVVQEPEFEIDSEEMRMAQEGMDKERSKRATRDSSWMNDGEEEDYPGYWQHRPVNLGVGPCGVSSECLYVTSDASNIIIAIAYGG